IYVYYDSTINPGDFFGISSTFYRSMERIHIPVYLSTVISDIGRIDREIFRTIEQSGNGSSNRCYLNYLNRYLYIILELALEKSKRPLSKSVRRGQNEEKMEHRKDILAIFNGLLDFNRVVSYIHHV